MEKENKYIVVKGVAGMGNRILFLLVAMVYARITNRILIVDWRDGLYYENGINSFHEFFESPLVDKNQFIPIGKPVFPECWKNNENATIEKICISNGLSAHTGPGIRSMSIDINNLEYDQNVLFSYGYGFFLDYKKHFSDLPVEMKINDYRLFFKFLIKNYLHLKENIRTEADEFKKKYFGKITIGIHIRQTDNIRSETRRINIKKHVKIITKLIKKHPKAVIFLSTDNKNILDEYVKKYKNVVFTEKFFGNDITEGLHHSKECKNKKNMAIEALKDMYLLSRCDYLVYSSKSSFGQVSSLFFDGKKNNLIDFDKKVYLYKRIIKKWLFFSGNAGIILKKASPFLYSKIKPYFPDKKL